MYQHQDINLLSEVIGYNFQNINILKEALTHPSCKSEDQTGELRDYQRLEFLGDSVLSLISAEILLNAFPDSSEGNLAKRQVALVCGDTLVKVAKKIGLGNFMIMTESEAANGGRESANNLENVLEALIGAIYVDGGMEAAKSFVRKYWQQQALGMKVAPREPKTSLQELLQELGKALPEYRLIERAGPPHAPIFTIEIFVDGVRGFRAQGRSKKLAERKAAALMLEYLEGSSIFR
ncbi:ribonuclease 3 [Rickettsiales bacterium]|nr:ribonuclease 3 [Rickettsiales bacterium]